MELLNALLTRKAIFNVSREHVFMFKIKEGEILEVNNSVILDLDTFEAVTAEHYINNAIHFGIATNILELKDGSRLVICRDGYKSLYNPSGDITEDDIGTPCYFDGKNTVSLNDSNAIKAGEIVYFETSDDKADIEDGTDRIVAVRVSPLEEGCVKAW